MTAGLSTAAKPRIAELAAAIKHVVTRPWTIMEVCGGQTHSILRHGLADLLPESVTLIHGPGCPVCVTPAEDIDAAIALAGSPATIVCCFGDMLRVPGSTRSLLQARAHGAQVQIIYSPLDALALARRHADANVVLFAVGFETTAPSTALTLMAARATQIDNFFVLCSHVQVPAALRLLLSDPSCTIDGFLAAGHVCAVMGIEDYGPIAEQYRVPIVVTGFDAEDILRGALTCLTSLETGCYQVQNAYARVVNTCGNREARAAIDEVFQTASHPWRGFGEVAGGGYHLREKYRRFDARSLTPGGVGLTTLSQQSGATSLVNPCISGLVLRGRQRPDECPAFGTHCTPETPLGAPMVSSEGACAAYARYKAQFPRVSRPSGR